SWGRDREEARRRMVAALGDTAVVGFTTNVEFLRALLELPDVVAGTLDTGLIARALDGLSFAAPGDRDFQEAALLMDAARGTGVGPWHRRDGWRLGPAVPRQVRLVAGDGTRHTVRLAGPVTAPVVVTDDGELPAQVRRHGHWATVTIDGVGRSFTAVVGPDGVQLNREGALFDLRRERTDH